MGNLDRILLLGGIPRSSEARRLCGTAAVRLDQSSQRHLVLVYCGVVSVLLGCTLGLSNTVVGGSTGGYSFPFMTSYPTHKPTQRRCSKAVPYAFVVWLCVGCPHDHDGQSWIVGVALASDFASLASWQHPSAGSGTSPVVQSQQQQQNGFTSHNQFHTVSSASRLSALP